MAKKSKRSRNRNPRSHPPFLRRSDRIKAVACLDYSLQHHIDLTSVAVTSIDRLEGCSSDVAEKAIRGALKTEHRDYGRDDGDISFEAFLAEGSAFLRYTEDDFQALRAEGSCLQPRLRRRNPPKSVRQTSRARTRKSSTLSLRRSARPGLGRISIQSTPESASSVDALIQQTPETAKARPSVGPSHKSGRISRARASTSATVTPDRPIRGVKREACPERAMEIAETASPPSPSGHLQNGRLSTVDAELALKNMELQTALRRITEQEDYIFTLSNRLLAAEKECKEIERSISQAAEHRQDLAVQETLRYECSVLRDQNIKMTSQRQVISLAAKGSLGPTGRNIREDFELILAGLKDACSSLDIIIPAAASDAKNVSREATAELWSQRLTGSNLYELGSRVSMDEISGVQFMSALAAVAIAELVFESDFPDFLARESPLLDQYREHILQKAGPQTLADLDLLAYHSILSDAEEDDDSYFHSHLLANTARSLSSKMVHAIASLISSGTEPPHNSATSDTFVEPILQALKLKANLTLTRKRYAVVFPQPGDAFDPTTMIPDGESQRQMPPPGQFAVNSKAKTVQSRVKLCLFPGLRVYAKRDEEEDEGWSFRGKQSGVGANVRSCLVRCNNFEKNPGRGHGFEEVRELEDIGDVYEVEGRARASMTGYVPLVRAVVLA